MTLSGPPSCLCSKIEECEITEENELEAVSNIYEVILIESLRKLKLFDFLVRRRLVRSSVLPSANVLITLGMILLSSSV